MKKTEQIQKFFYHKIGPSKKLSSHNRYKKYFGFCLIEVLIATFILTTSLLFIISFENACLAQTHNAYLNSIATNQIVIIAERFHAGVGKSEFKSWNQDNARLLPHGFGTYTGNSSSGYKITLCWHKESDKKNCLSTTTF